MAFIVEDGTGKSDASAYIDEDFADDYFSDRTNAEWAALISATKQSSIIKATDHIDAFFTFQGSQQHSDQALQFPRDLWPDSVPVNIKKATAEYALRASRGDLSVDPSLDSSGYAISEKTSEVGLIKKGIKYAVDAYSGSPTAPSYPAADNLLKPFISSGNVKFIKRA